MSRGPSCAGSHLLGTCLRSVGTLRMKGRLLRQTDNSHGVVCRAINPDETRLFHRNGPASESIRIATELACAASRQCHGLRPRASGETDYPSESFI